MALSKLALEHVPGLSAVSRNFEALQSVLNQLLGTRTVGGIVSSAGAVVEGSEFTVSHSTTGTYVVTFSTAFSSPPAVSFAVGNTGGIFGIRHGATVTTTSFTALTFNSSGSLTNSEFHFVAEGPA